MLENTTAERDKEALAMSNDVSDKSAAKQHRRL